MGRADVALDVLAKRGDWERLWEVASKEKMATAVVSKFIIMRVEEVREGLSLICTYKYVYMCIRVYVCVFVYVCACTHMSLFLFLTLLLLLLLSLS